jgi:hypothetical protein
MELNSSKRVENLIPLSSWLLLDKEMTNHFLTGSIYLVNQEAVRAGRHGCDPPWGYIADRNPNFPGYCC